MQAEIVVQQLDGGLNPEMGGDAEWIRLLNSNCGQVQAKTLYDHLDDFTTCGAHGPSKSFFSKSALCQSGDRAENILAVPSVFALAAELENKKRRIEIGRNARERRKEKKAFRWRKM